jgi:hypothetical protein
MGIENIDLSKAKSLGRHLQSNEGKLLVLGDFLIQCQFFVYFFIG